MPGGDGAARRWHADRQRAGMRPEQACAVGLAVSAALSHAHAHARNVLHRDVKADTILFTADGTVKVGDFGIAKLFEGSATTASKVAGTPVYMAPEQIEGGRLVPATDLYALGIVLYRLLTGRPPFDPKLPLHILWRRQLTEPAPPMDGVAAPVAEVALHGVGEGPGRPPVGRHRLRVGARACHRRGLRRGLDRPASTDPRPRASRRPRRRGGAAVVDPPGFGRRVVPGAAPSGRRAIGRAPSRPHRPIADVTTDQSEVRPILDHSVSRYERSR